MTYTLIEANHLIAEQAKTKIKNQNLPVNIDSFIALFNDRVINTSNKSIRDIADLLSSGYSNLEVQNNKILVKSEEEATLETTGFYLEQYKIVASLKRIAEDLLTNDYSADTKILIKRESPGYVYLEPDEDTVIEDVKESNQFGNKAKEPTRFAKDDFVSYTDAGRYTSSKNALANNIFLNALIKDYNEEEETAYLVVGDLVKISLQPINNLKQFIAQIKNITDNK